MNRRKHKQFREESPVPTRGPGEGDETQVALREVKTTEKETQKLILKKREM